MKLNTCVNYSVYAYILMTYVLGSVFYLLITRTYGTPFKTAVKEYPELMEIKLKSVDARRKAFYIGLGIAILLLTIFRPYGNIF
jgi:hypothetical protein